MNLNYMTWETQLCMYTAEELAGGRWLLSLTPTGCSDKRCRYTAWMRGPIKGRASQ
ncbi:hypothetical protein KDW_23570 [Dictyobacter vulcani]|uniref:Uncharacterized protein n=1 Tax=Dictyobacter vulcani TaxID=2607529 RepID=A0A5J4KK43_9CHLR|nr:hypothetical protein KDW_23570 [Dictyobacter vulcani]